MKEREAQCLHGREARECCVFARTAALLGTGVDLEVRQQIVRQGDELLPGAVGGVSEGGHGMEGESAFQLRDGLLVRPAAGHKVPEVRERVVEVARDGRVIVVAVIAVEEVQLEVFRREVYDPYA